jgi:HSP20 family protein
MMKEERIMVELSELDPRSPELLGLWRDPAGMQRLRSRGQPKAWHPPTDVYETHHAIVVKVEIAGMQVREIDVALQGQTLTIGGERHDSGAKLRYQQMEIQYGRFETSVELPGAVDPEGIEATYSNGFLVVRLPQVQSHRVRIKPKSESS